MDEYQAEAEKRVGTTIAGRWRVERVLGVGGMACVVFARAPDGATAAIKILHEDVNAIPELRKRFLREAPIGDALQNPMPVPGIVRMIEVGEDTDGSAYIAMEAIDGETLYDRATRDGTLPLAETLEIGEQVLDVLVAVHARGVIHRDLKPENIHLGKDGRIRVLDFGIARVLDALPRGEAGFPEKTPTRTGVIMGTAAYMGPEQATGLVSETDGRTDLFSLGATLFRMLAGRTVHGPLTDTMELIAAATEHAPPLASLAPNVPRDVCAVVDRALAFMKPHRYPDALTMREDVRALRRGATPPYVGSIGAGRAVPGPPHPIEPTIVDPPRTSPTEPDVTPTVPELAPPGPTLDDSRSQFRVLALTIAGLALVGGVSVGIGLATCRSNAEPDPAAMDGGAGSADAGADPAHTKPALKKPLPLPPPKK